MRNRTIKHPWQSFSESLKTIFNLEHSNYLHCKRQTGMNNYQRSLNLKKDPCLLSFFIRCRLISYARFIFVLEYVFCIYIEKESLTGTEGLAGKGSTFSITTHAGNERAKRERAMRRPLAATFLCFLLPFSAATVVLNPISTSFADLPAKYAGSVNKHGICGALFVADPLDGCSPLRDGVASNRTEQGTKLALIVRGKCSFEEKLVNAQNSGFVAVIVYDDRQNDDLLHMKVNPEGLMVQAVFVSNTAGEILRKNAKGEDGECCIYPASEGRAWTVLAMSFLSLVLVITFLLIVFFIPTPSTQWLGRHKCPRRVDAQLVEALPCFTFRDLSEHNAGETCAICLEDYRIGDYLRLLPCQHSFHVGCVDSWLTQWGTSCPICKLDMRSRRRDVIRR